MPILRAPENIEADRLLHEESDAEPPRRRLRAGAAAAASLLGVSALLFGGTVSLRHSRLLGLQRLDEEKSKPTATLPITVKSCTTDGGCADLQLGLTIDANWRWYHNGAKPCGDCVKEDDCSECKHQEHVDYEGAYGVSVDGDALNLKKSARLYFLDPSGNEYYVFKLLGKEFAFDVDMSGLPCGVNSALYTVEMDKDGGYDGGARIGTGYCDAQCPKGMKTIGGKPDLNNTAQCCNEMDLWEANRRATAMTMHPCQAPGGGDLVGTYACKTPETCNSKGDEGVCDAFGCDVNPYRLGFHTFYQESEDSTVTTSKVMTVTTQFVEVDGVLSEIRRTYTQDGETHELPPIVLFDGEPVNATLSDEYCLAESKNFSGGPVAHPTPLERHGGLEAMGKSLGRGNVLVISLWNDAAGHMLWLDGTNGNDASAPGEVRGPCGHKDHSDGLEDVSVTFSNLRFGDIGSTAGAAATGPAVVCILLAAVTALSFADRHQ